MKNILVVNSEAEKLEDIALWIDKNYPGESANVVFSDYNNFRLVNLKEIKIIVFSGLVNEKLMVERFKQLEKPSSFLYVTLFNDRETREAISWLRKNKAQVLVVK